MAVSLSFHIIAEQKAQSEAEDSEAIAKVRAEAKTPFRGGLQKIQSRFNLNQFFPNIASGDGFWAKNTPFIRPLSFGFSDSYAI